MHAFRQSFRCRKLFGRSHKSIAARPIAHIHTVAVSVQQVLETGCLRLHLRNRNYLFSVSSRSTQSSTRTQSSSLSVMKPARSINNPEQAISLRDSQHSVSLSPTPKLLLRQLHASPDDSKAIAAGDGSATPRRTSPPQSPPASVRLAVSRGRPPCRSPTRDVLQGVRLVRNPGNRPETARADSARFRARSSLSSSPSSY